MGELIDPSIVRRCSVLPYRYEEGAILFCLVLAPADRSWEFPTIEVQDGTSHLDELARCAQLDAGLHGTIDASEPLGEFRSSRGNTSMQWTAYLMAVARTEEQPTDAPRRRWCLATEAKARVRRKPIRRLIDTAQRRLERGLKSGGERQDADP